MDRRTFLARAAGAGAGVTGAIGLLRVFGPAWDNGEASPTMPRAVPTTAYGEISAPDALGIQLPPGFTARLIATSGEVVGDTSQRWHIAPDGGACFEHPKGGWVYVSNSEAVFGGVGALRFDERGDVVDAYRILAGTTANCAGGATPWGTWLSCEEHPGGQVWECDPLGKRDAVARPAMGRFFHEAAACDPDREVVYLTEDQPSGMLRRFRPDRWGDLASGTLEAAVVVDGSVTWTSASEDGTPFNGGEGAWYEDGRLWFTTKGDNRVWELDVRTEPNALRVLYDDDTSSHPILTGVDNIVGNGSGDLFVCEDGGSMELVRLSPAGEVTPFLRVQNQHGSELAGAAFSPDGTRLYVSSQRGIHGAGLTYEISGPFNT